MRGREPMRGPRAGAADVPADLPALQRRIVRVLAAGQVLGGIAIGATLAIGAILAARVSGEDALSGTAATVSTLGAAGAAIPLARLASQRGRRVALITGVLAAACGAAVTVAAVAADAFPLLLVGYALLGVGSAVSLQSRFAAADLAGAGRRGRDLSLVVWSTTIGAVLGPNLFAPGEAVAAALGMPPLTGSFVLAVAAQFAAAAVYAVGLRPDPYLVARAVAARPSSGEPAGSAAPPRIRGVLLFAVTGIAGSHAVMVAVMSMTPVHLIHHGATIALVGLTISLHVAGMYALSPVFGVLSDRMGSIATMLLAQVVLLVSLVVTALGQSHPVAVTVGLVLLGLGWSAGTVSGSALVASAVPAAHRPRVQGRTDLAMNLSGAGGGALAGVVLALIGYAGLAWAAIGVVLPILLASVVMLRRGRSKGAGRSGAGPAPAATALDRG